MQPSQHIIDLLPVQYRDILFLSSVHSTWSDCYIDKDKKFALKILHNEGKKTNLKWNTFLREISVLRFLNSKNIDWAPKLYFYTTLNNSFLMLLEYCGEHPRSDNIPIDFNTQIDKIFSDLTILKIQHNDIIRSNNEFNILIKNNKIYIIDFEWCTIHEEQRICINAPENHKAPAHFFTKNANEPNFIKAKLAKIKKTSIQLQSETPSLEFVIKGYQQFTVDSNKKITFKSKKHKYETIEKKLLSLKESNSSIADIGANNGLVCLIAYNLGYKEILGLDIDKRHIDFIKQLKQAMDLKEVEAKLYSFGDDIPQSDVTVMLALIHWIYSYTCSMGNFDKIFNVLKKCTKNVLLIEWIDEKDRYAAHVNRNKKIHTEKYCTENFERAAKKIGVIIDKTPVDYDGTRVLYTICINK